MIDAGFFVEAIVRRGVTLWAGVPCSWLQPFIGAVEGSNESRYVGCTNEGDAIALAAGANLAGAMAAVVLQNSGLGNAVSPLTSLTHTFRIPVLLFVSLRGEPGGSPDEPQHEQMGAITAPMLEVMGIPWEVFPTREAELDQALDRAIASMRKTMRPFAFVMRKGSLAKCKHRPVRNPRWSSTIRAATSYNEATATRNEMIVALRTAARPEDVLIATTGYTGRELFASGDAQNQFYMVGSMGCAGALGLGIALTNHNRRVIVLDGDGALLMRLGTLSVVGAQRPSNFLHVLFDNGCYESTGGQLTTSQTTDLAAVAAACGYPLVCQAQKPGEIKRLVEDRSSGPRFVHALVRSIAPTVLPRPTIRPQQVADRLRENLSL